MTRILTSHVGSLPRTQDVVDFIFARENEEAYNQDAFDSCMRDACAETVRRQADAALILYLMVKHRKFPTPPM